MARTASVRTYIVLCTAIDYSGIGEHGFFKRKPHLAGLRVAGHWNLSGAFLRSWNMTVALNLKPCLDLVNGHNCRVYPCNNRWKTTALTRAWAKLTYQRGAQGLQLLNYGRMLFGHDRNMPQDEYDLLINKHMFPVDTRTTCAQFIMDNHTSIRYPLPPEFLNYR